MNNKEEFEFFVRTLPLTQYEKNELVRMKSIIWQEGFMAGQRAVVTTQEAVNQLLKGINR